MKNKIILPILILLLAITSVFALERNQDYPHRYDGDDVAYDSDTYFNEPTPYTAGLFWFDSQNEYTITERSVNTKGVSWYDTFSGSSTTNNLGVHNNIMFSLSFNKNLSDTEIILQAPTELRVLKPVPQYQSFSEDSSVSTDEIGSVQTTGDYDNNAFLMQYRNRHASFIDLNNDTYSDIVLIEESGSDQFIKAYTYDSGITLMSNYTTNITHARIDSSTTGNINCYENILADDETNDVCIVVNSYCEMYAFKNNVSAGTLDEYFYWNFSAYCENLAVNSSINGISGILSNMVVTDAFDNDGILMDYTASFIYHISGNDNYEDVLMTVELNNNSKVNFTNIFITSTSNNVDVTSTAIDEINLMWDYMTGSDNKYFVAFYSGAGTGSRLHVWEYDFDGVNRTTTTAFTNTDGDWFDVFFINLDFTQSGNELCEYKTGECYDSVGNNVLNMTGSVTKATDGRLTGWFYDDTDPLLDDNIKFLFHSDRGVNPININNAGFSSSPEVEALVGDFGNTDAPCFVYWLDNDDYPDLICSDYISGTGSTESVWSSVTNFPPIINISPSNWDTSDTCFQPSNVSDTSFCWKFTCIDTENDWVKLEINFNATGWNTFIPFESSFRCNDGLITSAGTNIICDTFDVEENITPQFRVNQTATFPGNTDTATSPTLSIDTEDFCVNAGATSTTTTEISTNFSEAIVSGSWADQFNDALAVFKVDDQKSKLIASLFILIGLGAMFVIGLSNKGVEGNGIMLITALGLLFAFVVLTYLGLIPLGLIVVMVILIAGFGLFKLFNNG